MILAGTVVVHNVCPRQSLCYTWSTYLIKMIYSCIFHPCSIPRFSCHANCLAQIRDSNRAMILSAATQHQCKVVDLGIAPDDEEEINKILDSAFSSGIDILIVSGGVSMGDRDYVKPLLEKRGKVHFHKVK